MFSRRSLLLSISFFLIFLFSAKSFDFADDARSVSQSTNIETFYSSRNSHSLRRSTHSVLPKRNGSVLLLKGLTAIVAVLAVFVLIAKCIRSMKPNSNSATSRRLSGGNCIDQDDIPTDHERQENTDTQAEGEPLLRRPSLDSILSIISQGRGNATENQGKTQDDATGVSSSVSQESLESTGAVCRDGQEETVINMDKDAEGEATETVSVVSDGGESTHLMSEAANALQALGSQHSIDKHNGTLLKKAKKRERQIFIMTTAIMAVLVIVVAALLVNNTGQLSNASDEIRQLTTSMNETHTAVGSLDLKNDDVKQLKDTIYSQMEAIEQIKNYTMNPGQERPKFADDSAFGIITKNFEELNSMITMLREINNASLISPHTSTMSALKHLDTSELQPELKFVIKKMKIESILREAIRQINVADKDEYHQLRFKFSNPDDRDSFFELDYLEKSRTLNLLRILMPL